MSSKPFVLLTVFLSILLLPLALSVPPTYEDLYVPQWTCPSYSGQCPDFTDYTTLEYDCDVFDSCKVDSYVLMRTGVIAGDDRENEEFWECRETNTEQECFDMMKEGGTSFGDWIDDPWPGWDENDLDYSETGPNDVAIFDCVSQVIGSKCCSEFDQWQQYCEACGDGVCEGIEDVYSCSSDCEEEVTGGFCEYYTSYRHVDLCNVLADNGYKFAFHPWNYETQAQVKCQDYQDCLNDQSVPRFVDLERDIYLADTAYGGCIDRTGGPQDCGLEKDLYDQLFDQLKEATSFQDDCVEALVGAECCQDVFASFQAECAGLGQPPIGTEVCNNRADDDSDTLVDCNDPDCVGDVNCVFAITGVIKTGSGKRMKGVLVTLRDEHRNTIVSEYTDDDGLFVLDYIDKAEALGLPSEQPVMADIQVTLKDENGQVEIIWDFQDETNEVYNAITNDVTLPTNEHLDLTMSHTNDVWYLPSLFDNVNWSTHWDASNLYYESLRAVEFIRNDLGYNFNGAGNSLPLSIYVYSNAPAPGRSLFSATRKGTGGVFLSPWDSSVRNTECPENCVWHEIFHWTMYNKYAGFSDYGEGNRNHAGFKNNRTEDSLWEGFAEFWPNILDEKLNEGGDKIYAGYKSVEFNYNPWMRAGKDEEFAFTTLLWDMYDSEASINDDGEAMSVSHKDLWNILMSKRLHNIKEVYDAAIAKWPDKISDIDKIFVLHGFFKDTYVGNKEYDLGEPFWDKDKDGTETEHPNRRQETDETYVDIGTPDNATKPHQVYTPGEEIGTASNYERPWRQDEPLEDSFVMVGLIGVSDPLVKVSYTFSDPTLNYEAYDLIDLETGYAYVEIAPAGYGMTATLTIDNYEDSEAIVITTDDFYTQERVENGYMKAQIINVGAKKQNYCNNNGKCEYVEGMDCGDCFMDEPVVPPTQPPQPPTSGNQTVLPFEPPASGDNSLALIALVVIIILLALVVFVAVVKKRGQKSAKQMPVQRFCTGCGNHVGKNEFCPKCGAKVV